MSTDLQIIAESNSFKDIACYLPEHTEMLEVIRAGVPEIVRANSLFGKTQSQFMDNMLTVSKPTPIRNLRQILAEMNRTNDALKEAYIKCKRREIERKIALRDSEKLTGLEQELKQLEAFELESQIESTKLYISGAIRKLTNYQIQYNSILESIGVKTFNEIDFEAEEERYHIMTAFEQGLTAARSRNGIIDEGNLIYLSQIGINGAVAQRCVQALLQIEAEIFKTGHEPSYLIQLNFLNDMAKKFKGCSAALAKHKGQTGTITELAALKTGDIRLLAKQASGDL